MKIAHLSDLHICPKFKRKNIAKTKKVIKHALDSGADHFIITGDIADNAKYDDFVIFRKILQSFDLLSAEKTSIVIGNHDIFGGVQTAGDVVNFPSKCSLVNYKEQVDKFVKYFEELFENTFSPSKENPFPYAKEIDNVVLIGLNSIDEYSKLKNPFASNGKIDKNQFSHLKKIFDIDAFREKIKIVLVHHHFYKNNILSKSSESAVWNRIENFTMKLRKKKKLLNLFKENNTELVLHGHSHEIKEYYRKGIKFLNAGGTVENDEANEAGYYLLDINENGIDVKLKLVNSSLNNSEIKIKSEVFVPQYAG
ncbi:MAG: metallophosphoesterase [Bacteroidota bacterium]